MQGKNLTSIIILTYNQLEYTKLCIESIRKKTARNTYEIIVVDNGSKDDTPLWLDEQKDIRCIKNENNEGFPKGCNQGIAIAEGTEILLLNNDTIVTDRWLDNLKTALYSDEKIGAVGPVTNNCSAYQSIEVPYTNIGDMQVFADQYNQLDSNKWENRVGLVGFCMLIKREVIESIGALDELFSPGNFEDDDYSLRIISAGYFLLLCHDTFIHHFGSVSFKERPAAYVDLLETNANKFKDKWGFSHKKTNVLISEIGHLVNDDVENVLEIGCGCGATLSRFKWQNSSANLYGVALSQKEALIAGNFFDVCVKDISEIENLQLNLKEKSFDVIILNDILNRLKNPKAFLLNLKRLIKRDGCLFVSVANISYAKILVNLSNGHWQYSNAPEYIRHFTLSDLRQLFSAVGYEIKEVTGMLGSLSADDVSFIEHMKQFDFEENKKFKYESYILKVRCNFDEDIYSEEVRTQNLKFLLRRIEYDINQEENLQILKDAIRSRKYEISEIVDVIDKKLWTKIKVAVLLSKELYIDGLIDEALQVLIKLYALHPIDAELIYALAYMLDLAGARKAAVDILNNFKGNDPNINDLLSSFTKI